MKKLLIVTLLLCGASMSLAQSRDVGAFRLVLDNGGSPLYRLTLQADPTMTGDATFTFPSGGGSFPGNGVLEGQTLRWNNTLTMWEPSSYLTNTGTRLGFGTSGPLYHFHMRDTQATSTGTFVAQTVTTGSGSGSANYGGYFEVIAEGTGSFISGPLGLAGRSTITRAPGSDVPIATGIVSSIDHSGTGTVIDAKSMNAQINNASGTLSKATALKATIFNSTQIDSLFGLHIMGPINTGTITAEQAIRVDEIPGSAAANLVFRYNHATNPVQIDNNGKLQFGGTTLIQGVDRIELNSTSTSNTQVVGVYGKLTAAPSGAAFGNRYGLAYEVVTDDGGTMTGARATGVSGGVIFNRTSGDLGQMSGTSGYSATAFGSSANVLTANGVTGQVYHQGSGAVTDGVALRGIIFLSGSGGMTNAYGLKLDPPQVSGSGAIGNLYGIHISDLTLGTTNTAILYDHAAAPFVVTGAGDVGVRTNAPTTSLDVRGSLAIQTGASVSLAAGGPYYVLNINAMSALDVSADAAGSTLGGLVPAGDGHIMVLYSTGTGNLTISNEDLAITDTYRFRTMTGADIATTGEAAITLMYNSTLSRWIVISVQD